MEREWFDWTEEDLQSDVEKQKQVFLQMIRRLEDEGKCRHVFHSLADVLFDRDERFTI